MSISVKMAGLPIADNTRCRRNGGKNSQEHPFRCIFTYHTILNEAFGKLCLEHNE